MAPSNIDDPQFGERQALERTQVVQPGQPSQPAAPQSPPPGASAAGQQVAGQQQPFTSEDDYVSPFAAIPDTDVANALFRATVWGNIAMHDGAHPELVELFRAAQQDLEELTGQGEEAPKKPAAKKEKPKKQEPKKQDTK